MQTADWPKIKALLDAIPGWLEDVAAQLTIHLAGRQRRLGIAGDVLEIGVYRGKYLALLAACADPEKASIVGVDAFLRNSVEPVEEPWASIVETEVRANVGKFWDAPERVHIVRADSRRLGTDSLAPLLPNRPSLISVDGGHDAPCVIHDMGLAAGLMAGGGFVSADDVFNFSTPGVAEGMAKFLCAVDDRGLAAFALCYNKLFLCDREFHAEYLRASLEFLEENAETEFGRRTLQRREENREMGWEPRYFGSRVAVFL
jgi:hypothetical protein